MGVSPAVRPVRPSLASGRRMAVKIKPNTGCPPILQTSTGRVARTQGMGPLSDCNSEHLLILHALGTLLAALAAPSRCFWDSVLTTHSWVFQVCPVL